MSALGIFTHSSPPTKNPHTHRSSRSSISIPSTLIEFEALTYAGTNCYAVRDFLFQACAVTPDGGEVLENLIVERDAVLGHAESGGDKGCPKVSMRKVPRSIYEPARDVARQLRGTPDYEFMRHERKKVEMSFAHLKAILKLDRLRLRGPCGVNDEFLLAATAQNLRKMAKLYINGRKMSTA